MHLGIPTSQQRQSLSYTLSAPKIVINTLQNTNNSQNNLEIDAKKNKREVCVVERKSLLTHIPKSKLLNQIFDNINVDSDTMLKKYKDRELV